MCTKRNVRRGRERESERGIERHRDRKGERDERKRKGGHTSSTKEKGFFTYCTDGSEGIRTPAVGAQWICSVSGRSWVRIPQEAISNMQPLL